ncbi:TIGR04326 family surface carbohydrate biosynthesis protein [Candidatus Methylopumilus planktonicus]|uniref:TIGR04326 family surface carbohydrate biosynthesis protein n=1 Tax=Candidatus Methylopumilus planktonicus TaxID=1581557 RepID=UPI003BEF174B
MTNLPFKNNFRNDVLLIWDSKSPPPKGDWNTVLWSQHADRYDANQVSIFDIVEKNSDVLRARYLAWIYELGESKIAGKRVIDHLSIRPEFSYWWTSSLAQKFNCSGTSQINNSIKALALESLFVGTNFKSVILNSENIILANVISGFCLKKNINFEFHKIKSVQKIIPSKLLLSLLPGSIVALIYLLRYVFRTAPLYFSSRFNTFKNIGDVMFFDVLVHLDKQVLKGGRFRSNYWTSLVNKLHEAGVKSNWTHLFFMHPTVPSISKAFGLTNKFTFSSEGSEFHSLLEQPLTMKMLTTIVSDFFKIRCSISKLKIISQIRPADSDIDLWPFHEGDWRRSLCGSETIDTCIKLSCFTHLLCAIPKQRLGIYIAENQPWEMVLIYAWKLNGHGRLIGAPHTTIRYWDLRYFHDSRSYSIKKINDMPLPDFLAVNGPVAKEIMVKNFYPTQKLIEVEALRFLYLNRRLGRLKRSKHKEQLRVLICGDFETKTTQTMLEWIVYLSKELPNEALFVFKPHPAYHLKGRPHFKVEVSNEPLPELLARSDVVFTSNISSAAVDAYCSGIPVVQMLDAIHFNTSPLRNHGGLYARNAKELTEIISAGIDLQDRPATLFFNLDKNLDSWMKVIFKK